MQGVLLVNLGTPDAPEKGAVRAYLQQFLSDPRVLSMPSPIRWALLHGFILRTRPAKSAAAYRSIWTDRGSPLKFHSEDLAAALQEVLGEGYVVALGFRYGSPSMESAVQKLLEFDVEEIVLLPLYPQYANSTTGSTLAEYDRLARTNGLEHRPRVVRDFFVDDHFLDAFAAVIRDDEQKGAADHLLFSFHGLPQSHLKAEDPTGTHCLVAPDCCAEISATNQTCYRAQCYATANGIAQRLGRDADTWSVAFQSRLGRTPWLRPYTVDALDALAAQGVQSVRVVCPSFVADCLETLEEIAESGHARFIEQGGQHFYTVPSLNARPEWVHAVAHLVRNAAQPSDASSL